MTCDHREHTVAKALESVPGVQEVLEVTHAGASARIMAGSEATAARIESAVAMIRHGDPTIPLLADAVWVAARAESDLDLENLWVSETRGGPTPGTAQRPRVAQPPTQ